jgi:RND family efflux transporter MFP subunit
VEVVAAAWHYAPQTVKLQGSLLGDEQAVVGVKVAGRVDHVEVDVGANVRRGDKLAVLDLADFKTRIKQTQAELASSRARVGLKPGQPVDKLDPTKAPIVVQEKAVWEGADADHKRAATLVRNGGISQEEYQVRETAVKVAEARYIAALHQVDEQIAILEKHASALVLAEQALADATVTAPFDGIVATRHVAPGVYLQVGAPVMTLVRIDPLRFHAGVPERYALLVKVGQEALIRIEGQSSPLVGKVSRVSPQLNLTSRSLPIEVDVPNPDARLRAGLFAEADIVVEPRGRLLAVPHTAVVEFAGIEKVCVVKNGQAVLRKVVTGRKLGDQVEIVEGINADDQVALSGVTARPGPAVATLVDAKAPATATHDAPARKKRDKAAN